MRVKVYLKDWENITVVAVYECWVERATDGTSTFVCNLDNDDDAWYEIRGLDHSEAEELRDALFRRGYLDLSEKDVTVCSDEDISICLKKM